MLLGMIVLPACKSNLEAYNMAYQKLKDREEAQVNSRAKTTMSVRLDTASIDSTVVYRTENLTLLLGDVRNFKDYNVVARTFINRTNARGFYDQMKEDKYPALLVQNQDQLYRIIVASFDTPEQAESKKSELKVNFPDASVVFRKN